LILDEPFSGLDPVNRDAIKDAILDVRKQGTTVIFSTHDMKVAEQMCDTIFMIFRGKKVLDGTLAAIQAEYGSDTVRVRTPLDAGGCSRLPGVQHVNDFGQEKELRLSSGADPQATLRALVPLAPVDRFEVVHPSLHDIFVRIAGPAAEEPDHE
jgi:ABC-2 type transport system ATP-binding protein